MLLLLGMLILLALLLGPLLWIRRTLATHSTERTDYPGTGGELAEHLINDLGLTGVRVEKTDRGDHYSPEDRTVRLSEKNLTGRSITAAAVAAHEVGHALQHRDNFSAAGATPKKMVRHAIVSHQDGRADPLDDHGLDRIDPRRHAADRMRRKLQTRPADPRALPAVHVCRVGAGDDFGCDEVAADSSILVATTLARGAAYTAD
jgi:hypothetical protein